jgi:hypothetical protein
VPTTVDVAMKGVMLVLARCADKLVGNFVFYGRSSEEADGGADAGAAPTTLTRARSGSGPAAL